MTRRTLLFIVTISILAVIYTFTVTDGYYYLANRLQVNIGVFVTAIFVLSLVLLSIIFRLLTTERFNNAWYLGLLAVVFSIGILVIGFPYIQNPLQLLTNERFLPFWIIWIVLVLYPKLDRYNRYRWLALPFTVFIAVFIFHQFIPNVSCAVSGGGWVMGGIGQAQYCLYEYPDAEQICKSSDECLGGCVVYDWPTDEPAEYGSCKPTTSPFGCYGSIEYPESFACTD
jgi:hypothetical protein